MARLLDFPKACRAVGPWTLCKRVMQQVSEDNVATWAAALAYSWMFAIFPFIVVLLGSIPLIPQRFKPMIEHEVSTLLEGRLAQTVADPIKAQVDALLNKPSGKIISIGLLFTIYAASKGMSVTMNAIDTAYDVDRGRPFYKQQPLAIILTVVVASMILLVLLLLPIGTGVLYWLKSQNYIFAWAVHLVNFARYVVALLLLFSVLAIIYHYGPSISQPFVIVTPGAVFCVAVWLLSGIGFRIYLTTYGGAASYTKTYGAVAGAAILLLFFYFDALVLLIGAELNSEIDFALNKFWPSFNPNKERDDRQGRLQSPPTVEI